MNYVECGQKLREEAKHIVMEFMKNQINCRPGAVGMTQAEIFRSCGFDWGEYPKATRTNQQYWVVALLWELESEGCVQRNEDTRKWTCR